jgi:hypothetical protein
VALPRRSLEPPRSHVRGGFTTDRKKYVGSRVTFEVAPDSLNSRFLPLPDLRTNAVFAVDDDIWATCADLRLAFEVPRRVTCGASRCSTVCVRAHDRPVGC